MNSACPTCGEPMTGVGEDTTCFHCVARVSLSEPTEPSPPTHSHDLPPGQLIGEYELQEVIGRGGMGVVYKARQRRLQRTVAIKTIVAERTFLPDAGRRLRAEAEALGGLRHPHIVGVHEFLAAEGRLFIVMEFVTGRTLAEIARGQPMRPDAAARCVQKLASAVQYAHQRGILHRDLKPANVLIDELGEPRLTDFGLAKRLDSTLELTLSHHILGSPPFMSPEQVSVRHGTVDRASDVYSLGAILYFLLTGRPPFAGTTLEQTLLQVSEATPAPPRLHDPALPLDLETICLKALEKDPARRYESAQAIEEDLGRFLRGEPTLARPLGSFARLTRWSRREPALAALVAVILLGLLTFAATLLWAERRVQEREALVQRNAYVADMRLAKQALDANHRGRTLDLLKRYLPKNGSHTDLRGWEWRYLWNECQGDEIATIGQHASSVEAIVCSADGRRLATASSDGEVRLWNPSSWALIGQARMSNSVTSLAFSPDGQVLAGTSASGDLQLWNSDRLVPLREPIPIRIHVIPTANRINAVGFTLDGEQILLLTRYNVLIVKDWRGPAPSILEDQPSQSWLYGAFSPDSAWVASGENDGRLFLQNRRENSSTNWPGHAGMLTKLVWNPEGQQFATACSDSTVKIWQAQPLEELASWRGHEGSANALAFSGDGNRLATGGRDQTIRIWNPSSREAQAVLRGHLSLVESLCFTQDGRTLVSGSKDGSVKLWSANPDPPVSNIAHLPTNTLSMWLVADGSKLIRAKNLGPGDDVPPVEVRSTRDLQQIEISLLKSNAESLLDITSDGRWLARGTWHSPGEFATNHSIRIERIDSPDHRTIPSKPSLRSRFSEDGRLFASVDVQGTLAIWDWAIPTELARFSVPRRLVQDIAFSLDNRFLAISDENGAAEIFDLQTRLKIGSMKAQLDAPSVAISNDSRWVALASYDGTIRLWSIPDRREAFILRGSTDGLASVAFSRDSRRLATGTLEGTVKIWDLHTEQEILELRGHTDPAVIEVAFLPDDTLVSVSVDSMRRWSVAPPP